MCYINWAAFSWEAFATLVTGLAAVIGAVVIAGNQSVIQKKQVELAILSYKESLFDRRYAVYLDFIKHVNDLKIVNPGIMEKTIFLKIIETLRKSHVLFDKNKTHEVNYLINELENYISEKCNATILNNEEYIIIHDHVLLCNRLDYIKNQLGEYMRLEEPAQI